MKIPKYEIRLSQRAQKDFKSIQRYTLKRYDKKQAIKYSDLLKAGLEKIAKDPERYGHTRRDIPEKYKSCRIGEHNIIYRTWKNQILIIAILHGHMDFSQQLKDE